MVLVQTNDHHNELGIYYLSKGIIYAELCYPYVDKLALTTSHDVQRFQHYILLQTTTIIHDANPMKYILSCQILCNKYSKWIFILQEFDLEVTTTKSKKSLKYPLT